MQRIIDTVGHTPLVGLSNSTRAGEAQVLLKLERTNPAGSMKDRVARYVIDIAEEKGWLQPGGTIIESSSGNFGISLAMLGSARGYKVVVLIDPKTTTMNRGLMEAYGAEVIVVTEQDDSGSYHKTRIALANELHQKTPNSFRPDQCFNSLTADAHFATTAPELLDQCQGEIAAVLCPISTGGLLGGIARYMRKHSPKTSMVGIDAVGSGVFGSDTHSYLLPGMGLGWTPSNLSNIASIDRVYKVKDDDAFLACRVLAQREGVMVGASSGAALVAALSMAREWGPTQRVVVIAADSGERYLNTVFCRDWLSSHGLTYETSLELLAERVGALEVFSDRPSEITNFKPELAQTLGSPGIVPCEVGLNDDVDKPTQGAA